MFLIHQIHKKKDSSWAVFLSYTSYTRRDVYFGLNCFIKHYSHNLKKFINIYYLRICERSSAWFGKDWRRFSVRMAYIQSHMWYVDLILESLMFVPFCVCCLP